MEREAATEAARTAMRAEAARVQQARRARRVTEAEALASLEGRRALQALILDPEYVRKHYEVWLPNGMWGKKHEETGGHTPFEIAEYDIRSKEGELDGATLWCKLEASSAALICKCEVNQTVHGGERTWGGAPRDASGHQSALRRREKRRCLVRRSKNWRQRRGDD